MRTLKKLYSQKGTTLVETLATIVLLGLMGIALTSGIGAVQRAYNKVVRKANEQVLISTSIIEMRDMIRNSRTYVKKNNNILRFFSKDGYWFEFDGDDPDGIQVLYYADKDSESPVSTLSLIPKIDRSASKILTKYDSIAIDDKNRVYIEGLQAGDTTLIKEIEEGDNKYYITVLKKDGGD